MKSLLTTVFLFCFLSVASAADVAYKFTVIDTVQYQGQTDTIRLVDRNNKGEMVGINEFFQSYLISGSKVYRLNCLANASTVASSINNTGQIGGYCSHDNRVDGFVLDRKSGFYQLITFPGSHGTIVYGINDAGDAVGQYWTLDPNTQLGVYRGFTWIAGVFTSVEAPEVNGDFLVLNGINRSQQSVGSYLRVESSGGAVTGGLEIAFMMSNGQFEIIQYPETVTNFAYDVNNNGQAVGLSYSNSGVQTFFLYDAGQYFKITGLPEGAVAYQNYGWGLNDRGELVGTYSLNGEPHSFFAVPSRAKRR